jgi:Leucine-rich repeat (LRR) protein
MSKSTRMKTLILNTTEEIDDEDIIPDLSHISPDIFAKALTKLEIVQISEAFLTSDQLEALIKYMNKESNIKQLGIANNDVSKMDSDEFAKALNKLEKLDLSGTNFGDQEQPSAFFKQMVASTNLKVLDLGFNSFGNNNNRFFNPKVFARALNKIENLRMVGVDISDVQAQEFFKRMCVQTQIKELHFEDCKYDMSLVNPNFMASGLNKLTKLKMANSSINGPQCLELFLRMAQFTKLQYLDLSFLDLCGVPTDILAEALNKVEKVILSDCHITEDQFDHPFQDCCYFHQHPLPRPQPYITGACPI